MLSLRCSAWTNSTASENAIRLHAGRGDTAGRCRRRPPVLGPSYLP